MLIRVSDICSARLLTMSTSPCTSVQVRSGPSMSLFAVVKFSVIVVLGGNRPLSGRSAGMKILWFFILYFCSFFCFGFLFSFFIFFFRFLLFSFYFACFTFRVLLFLFFLFLLFALLRYLFLFFRYHLTHSHIR